MHLIGKWTHVLHKHTRYVLHTARMSFSDNFLAGHVVDLLEALMSLKLNTAWTQWISVITEKFHEGSIYELLHVLFHQGKIENKIKFLFFIQEL